MAKKDIGETTPTVNEVMETLRQKFRVSTGSNLDQYIKSIGQEPCVQVDIDKETMRLRCKDLGLRDGWTGNQAKKALDRSSRRSMELSSFLLALSEGKVGDGWYFIILDDGRVVCVLLSDGCLDLRLRSADDAWHDWHGRHFPSVRK